MCLIIKLLEPGSHSLLGKDIKAKLHFHLFPLLRHLPPKFKSIHSFSNQLTSYCYNQRTYVQIIISYTLFQREMSYLQHEALNLLNFPLFSLFLFYQTFVVQILLNLCQQYCSMWFFTFNSYIFHLWWTIMGGHKNSDTTLTR